MIHEELVKKIDNKQNLLLTGPAGTGKSTIIKAFFTSYKLTVNKVDL